MVSVFYLLAILVEAYLMKEFGCFDPLVHLLEINNKVLYKLVEEGCMMDQLWTKIMMVSLYQEKENT